MDQADLWASRLAAVKRQYALQQQQRQISQSDRLAVDELEAEEEGRTDLTCPYCYDDFDVGLLCSHLEDEHSHESRATVCPICSVKVSSDMFGHITLQHGQLFNRYMQRRRRLHRVGIPNSQVLSLLGRDLWDSHLPVLLGSGGYRSSNSTSANVINDLLSSLVLNLQGSEAEKISKVAAPNTENTSLKKVSSTKMWKKSVDSSMSSEEREQKMKQATRRAKFIQDVLLSTLFRD